MKLTKKAESLQQKYIAELKANCFSPDNDTEVDHIKADEVLIRFLKESGYIELANIYNNVDKWFA